MRSSGVSPALLAAAMLVAFTSATAQNQGRGGAASGGPAPAPLLQDYIEFSVTAPPGELELDPFYKKYVDAHGIPVVTSEKVPDAALLMARDIVQFMLAESARPPEGADPQEVEARDHGRDRGHVRHPRTPQVPAAAEDRRRAADAAAAGELQPARRRRHA